MNLFKKTTATLALVALVSGIFSTGVSASSNSEIDAANALAANGYINNHSSDTAAYNLNQNVLRQEIAAVARGIAGLDKKTSCDGSFTDVTATTPNTWACYSVEALLDADLIAANTMFKPENEISKAEAVGMMVKAAFGDEYAYDAGKATSWQEQVVDFAVANAVVSRFTNYDTAATRGFVFEAGYNAEMSSEEVVEECDEVSQLLGLCDEDVAETPDDVEEDDTPVVITGENYLAAELSANTPAGTDLPELANGVVVLAFDVTAGSEDVSITAMELERTGFGESAADEVAVYTNEGRASKAKSFSDSDDMANLTFSPAVVIKAGETRTLVAKVNTSADNGEFAVSVKNITASSPVEAGTIVSNYFDVKDVTAAQLTISDEGVNTAVKAGESQADLAEFKLTNEGNLATDVDVTVSSITLKEIGSVDQEDVLENITLTVNGDVISTVSSMEGKYVTFNFDPFVIEDDKNESFTVKADVMGGAGDEVQFTLDSVIDITAVASKYNAVNIAGTFAPAVVTVDAGELTLYSIDAESEEIRQDKSNVVIGQLKVVNVAGQNLELQNLGVTLTASSSWVLEILENVEFEINGTSYDLSTTSAATVSPATFSDTDLDIVLPQGTSILTVRADTLDDLNNGQTITMTLDASVDANFRVEETEDDEVVTDITPSSLTWDNVEVVLTAATASNVPLADVSVVKGAQDLVALQFEIEAGEASYVTTDRIKVTMETSTGLALTKDTISEVALYQGSVSESNLLDKVSGSKLDTNGVATFDGFEVEIAADSTETFLATVSTVDNDDVVGVIIVASIAATATDIDLEDDENDVVSLAAAVLSDKEITILDSGVLTISSDANNDDNDDTKTILAGTEMTVYSVDAIATNEEVSVETVAYTLDADLKNVVSTAKLYLDDTLVATASNSDVITGTARVEAVTAVAAVAQVSTITFAGTETDAADEILTTTITDAGGTSTFTTTVTASTAATAASTVVSAVTNVSSTATYTATEAAGVVTINTDTAGTAFTAATVSTTPGATTDITAGALVNTTDNVVAVAPVAYVAGDSVITFDNISNLDFPTESSELRLAIDTETIGYERIGNAVEDVKVTNLALTDAEGADSAEDVTVAPIAADAAAKVFAVVPATVVASVDQTLESGSVKVTVTVDTGDNTATDTASDPLVTIQGLGVVDLVTGIAVANFNMYEEGESVSLTEGSMGIVVSGSKTFDLIPAVTAAVTYTLRLPTDGIEYDAGASTGLTSNLSNELDLGTKTYE